MVRTRFAPSPTGYLHIGGVRTALFCWLFARRHGGQFILRIDDTDQERNVEQALAPILRGLKWLGIQWDEGPEVGGPHAPYRQSQRVDRYQEAVRLLLERGLAYRDYATTEEIQAEREAAQQEKRSFVYSRRWMAETPADAARFESAGRKGVVRLKMPRAGVLVIDDLVRGAVEFEWGREQDHVIQRTDGSCLYHLANVVDDHDFQITHVIRAEEHLSNTPRQIFIAQALGYPLPQYAHLPFVAEPGSRTKLSKRKLDKYLKNRDFAELMQRGRNIAEAMGLHPDPATFNPVIVDFYKQIGFLPEAILNYLALLGWSLDDAREDFTPDELIQHFSLERVNKAPASFDPAKLMSFQDRYMRRVPIDEKVAMVLPYLEQAGLVSQPPDSVTLKKVRRVLNIAAERIKIAGDILDYKFLFTDAVEYDEAVLQKRLTDPDTRARLRLLKDQMNTLASFSVAPLRETVRRIAGGGRGSVDARMDSWDESYIQDLAGELSISELRSFDAERLEHSLMPEFLARTRIKMAQIIHALRGAITGQESGPALFQCMELLGKEQCIRRIEDALTRVREPAVPAMLSRPVDIPEAINPAYPVEDAADDVPLYEGKMALQMGENMEGKGRLVFRWLPRPSVRFEVLSTSSGMAELGEATLRIPDLACEIAVYATSATIREPEGRTEFRGIPRRRVAAGQGSHIRRLVFHLPHFHEYIGRPIHRTYDSGGKAVHQSWAGRLVLRADDWKITIDALPSDEHGTSSRVRNPIRHVGLIERDDNRIFDVTEADWLMEALQYYLSFVRGLWTAPLLIVGYDQQGIATWYDWSLRQIEPWREVDSWCPPHRMEPVCDAFAEFAARWKNEKWRADIRTALYWYLLANWGTVEIGILGSQVVLERVAQMARRSHAIKNVQTELAQATESGPAGYTVNMPWISGEIPDRLRSLRHYANRLSLRTGVQALGALRNSILHVAMLDESEPPAESRREYQGWQLGMWCSELALLWAIGYKGPYLNRITAEYVSDYDEVPWDEPLPPYPVNAEVGK